jgi:hypothetical protein
MKKLFFAFLLAITTAAHAQFTPGQVLSANALNAAINSAVNSASAFQQAGAGGVATSVQTEVSRSYYLTQFASPAQAVTAAAGKRLYINAGQNVTLNVPGQSPDIQTAMTAIQDWVISGGGTVTIKVADGTYNIGAGINLNHPYGQYIQLIGDTSDPTKAVLMGPSPAAFNMLTVSNGSRFGLIDGFRIALPTKAALANNYSAIIALNGAFINLGPHIQINNWYYGINASYGSQINADYAQVTNAGDVGIWAFCGSQINARYAQSNNASDTVNGWGFGFEAEYASQVNAEHATATGNNIAGFAALSGSHVRAPNSSSAANVGSGYLTRQNGTIEAYGAASTNNTRYGLELQDGSGSVLGLSSNTGNTLGGANKYAYFDTSLGSARITSISGQLRLDTNDSSSTYFNTSGGPQAAVFHTASSVNYPGLTGGATGGPARIAALGSDSSIDLSLETKGGGALRFGTFTSGSDAAITGYITIKDSSGVVRKLAIIN